MFSPLFGQGMVGGAEGVRQMVEGSATLRKILHSGGFDMEEAVLEGVEGAAAPQGFRSCSRKRAGRLEVLSTRTYPLRTCQSGHADICRGYLRHSRWERSRELAAAASFLWPAFTCDTDRPSVVDGVI